MPNLNKGYEVTFPGKFYQLAYLCPSGRTVLVSPTYVTLFACRILGFLAGLDPTPGHPLGHGRQAAPTACLDRPVRAGVKTSAHFI